jgi:RNA polymerase sigma-70 factor (ECF subfamily)
VGVNGFAHDGVVQSQDRTTPSKRAGQVAESNGNSGRNETPLLPQIANGVPGSVEAFMDRYGGLVWSFARRLTPTRADAEDAVQEIFVDLWKSADRFDPELSSEPTFVSMVSRRRLIDRLNKRNRRIKPVGDAALQGEASRPISESTMEQTDEAKRAAEALEDLSEQQQRVLKLSIHYGQTHAQIAEITGLPLGTVKTLIRRGLIKVRKTLEQSSPEARGATS